MQKWAAMVMLVAVMVGRLTANPALRLQKSWDLRVAEWNLKVKSAVSPEAKAQLISEFPDPREPMAEMWRLIGPELAKEGNVEPAAWFLRTAHSWSGGALAKEYATEIEAVRKAVEQHHLRSPGLLPMCVALATSPDPHSLALLEKISKENPDEKVQGAASLGCALLLGQLGDDPDLMKRRLGHLRKAIIHSVEVDFGGKRVGELAEDELYVIQHLAKGRTAPDLTGIDAAGRSLRLSDYQGKVVYLLFWDAMMPERERVIAMADEVKARFEGKDFEVVGVCVDSLEDLRRMEADGVVAWRSFSDASGSLSQQYRVRTRPFVFVLDQQRRIQFSGMPGSFADLTCGALLDP